MAREFIYHMKGLTKTYTGGKFRVNIRTERFTDAELRRIDEQGDPEVDAGGDFTGPPEFTLPSSLRAVQGGFSGEGYTRSFDGEDYVNAQAMAAVYADEMDTAIAAAMQTLKDNDVTDFEGETVTPISYT